MITTVSNENEDLQKETEDLKHQVHVLEEKVKKKSSSKNFLKEKQTLNDKVKYLETTLYRCVNGKEKLYVILGKSK